MSNEVTELKEAFVTATGTDRLEQFSKEKQPTEKIKIALLGLIDIFLPTTGTIIREVVENPESTTLRGKQYTAIVTALGTTSVDLGIDAFLYTALREQPVALFPALVAKNTIVNFVLSKLFRHFSK